MCQFFSCIVTRQGEVRFCEDNSHETIIRRLGLDDTRPLDTRGWVRTERRYIDGVWQDVRVDETSWPAWWDAEFAAKVEAVSERVRPARAAYGAICDQARAAYDAIYDQPRAAYGAIYGPAQAAYDAACTPARAAYDAICDQARAAYDAIYGPARAAYGAAISTIEGYVPERAT